ncbi:MAG TPA: amino acid permease [Pyrinomonadaceae bacterium]|nr:amino acid permease [Pyrinomonadaceae bacterium]
MPAHGELKRQLGLGSAIALVISGVIGVGIFLYPAQMAKALGSPLLLLVVWLVMGLAALCGALCYGELAARFPEAGGGYVYLREAYGPRMAFLYGWMLLLVLDPGLTAALAVGLASYSSFIIPLSPLAMKVLGVGTILVLAGVNILGVRLGARMMMILTLLKVGLLLFIVCWGFGSGLGDWANFTPFAARREGSAGLLPALAMAGVAGFFSFAGWWDLTKLAGEVRSPAKTLPRALLLGLLVVTLVYVLTSAAFLYLVPPEQVPTDETSAQTFAAQVGLALFGGTGGKIFSGIVAASLLGSLAAYIMAAPRVYYAMARDHLFIKQVAAVHQRFGTPARAIALQALLASLLVIVGTFDAIIAYFFFVTIVFIALTVAAIFVLRRKSGVGASTLYRTPGYPLTPAFFLLIITAMLCLLAANNPKQALLGVGVVALGVPVYHLLFRKKAESGQ